MTYSNSPARREAEVAAYYAGRNSWFPGERIPRTAPYADAGLAAHWKRGLRNVLAEERLDQCVEWDND
jgi:hypothetical protein